MNQFIALVLMLCSIVASAQQIDAQTGNIVYTTLNPPPPGSPHTWTGFINSSTNGGGLSGGDVPAYNGQTGTFIFGYNQGTVAYTNSINFALANAGSNIQVNGFKYSWQYFNQDFSRGTLSGNISLTSNTGQTLQSYFFNMPQTTEGWTTMSGTKNFATQYAAAGLGNLNVSFTGKDDRWWAGYYGPQIRDIDVKLLYSVPVPKFSSWTNLTGENGTFTLSSPGIVRYGAEGTYIYQSYQSGTYECSNGAWGQDPIGGVYKSCSLGTNTTSTPPPTTTTATNNNATTTTTNAIIAAAAEPVLAPTTTTTTTASTTSTTGDPVSTTSTVTASAPQSSPAATTTAASSTTSSTTASTTAAATNPVTAAASAPSSGSSRTVDGTSIGLSVVARNQQREQAIAMQAAQTAVQSANETAAQVTQDAQNIASQAVSNSFAMAQTAAKPGGGAAESKVAANTTDLTIQSNTTAASMSLFASPTAATAQRQIDNTQNTTMTEVTVVQNSRTTQTTQPVQTVDTSSKTSAEQVGAGIGTFEIEQRPPSQSTVVVQQSIIQKTTSAAQPANTGVVAAENQNSQPAPLVSLLPPSTATSTVAASSLSVINNNKQSQQVAESANTQEVATVTNTVSYSLLPPQPPVTQSTAPVVSNFGLTSNQVTVAASQPVFTVTNEINTNDSQKMLLDRTSPVFQTLENRNFETASNQVVQQGPVVNRNAQNNEAAGNVDIARMAVAPAGYADYLSLTLRDAAFYAPKEVYPNQRTVDNARALRSLTNDARHRAMVEMQYAK